MIKRIHQAVRLSPRIISLTSLVAMLIIIPIHARLQLAKAAFNKSPTSEPQAQRPALKAVLLTLTPTGFQPLTLSQPVGPFILTVSNRSGLDASALSISTESGARFTGASLQRAHKNWSEIISLPPGKYTVKEVSHPEWDCTINITPQ